MEFKTLQIFFGKAENNIVSEILLILRTLILFDVGANFQLLFWDQLEELSLFIIIFADCGRTMLLTESSYYGLPENYSIK